MVDFKRVSVLAPGEDIISFLTVIKPERPEMARNVARQMLGNLQDLKEFVRVLVGAGPYHRSFLKAVFHGEGGIAEAYEKIYVEWLELPKELKMSLGNPSLPPPAKFKP
jgi:hypothetical protein